MAEDLLGRSALEQAELIRRGGLSSEELTRFYLDRVERLNGALGAFVRVFRRRALAAARAKDRRRRRGGVLPPFHGVPIGVKDLNFVRFSVTRFGSRAVPPIFWPADDRTVAGLRRAGFVVLGKTSTSEIGAMPVVETDLHPPTRNPWDLRHTAGGSSGGSASAVAAGLVPIAHGSDGAGSIRIPSALCGLYGLKPSRGRVFNAFGRPDRQIMYTCGPIARTVEDAAAMLDAMAGLDAGRPHWAPPPPRPYRALLAEPPRPLRVRVVVRSPVGRVHPEIEAAVGRAARVLADLGHDVAESAPPEGSLEDFLPLYQHLMGGFPILMWSRAQPITRWLGLAGRALRADDMLALQGRLSQRILGAFEGADVWITPAVPVPAPEIGAFSGRPPAEGFAAAAVLGAFTAAFNLTGQPAASVPLGLVSGGLPMGLQVVGRPLGEVDVLAVSRQLEQALPWSIRPAPAFDDAAQARPARSA